jgi:DNA-binding PadR family transcriptional regulator
MDDVNDPDKVIPLMESVLEDAEDRDPQETSEVHDLDEGIQTFEAFPEHTDAVLGTLAYSDEDRDEDSAGVLRTELTRTDIQYTLPPDIDLTKDQIKYRMEQLVEEELATVDWELHEENNRPTAYYEITPLGKKLLENHEFVLDMFGESPEEVTREDIYDVVDLLRESHRRLEDLESRIEELES